MVVARAWQTGLAPPHVRCAFPDASGEGGWGSPMATAQRGGRVDPEEKLRHSPKLLRVTVPCGARQCAKPFVYCVCASAMCRDARPPPAEPEPFAVPTMG